MLTLFLIIIHSPPACQLYDDPIDLPKRQKPQEHYACSWGSVIQVAFLSSRKMRVNSANVFSSTRKCNTVGTQSIGMPRGALHSPLSDAVNQAGGLRTLPCSIIHRQHIA